jgi:hypothetical protein
MRQVNGNPLFSEQGTPEFHIPNHYVGWVGISFDVEGAFELDSDPRSGRQVIVIPATGKAVTTSGRTFWRQLPDCNPDWPRFFYYSPNGQLIEPLAHTGENPMIWNFRTGSNVEGHDLAWFFVGTAAEYQQYGGERIYGGLRQPDGSVIFNESE